VKHPFDVGDRIVVDKDTYTVKEISLLSTVFLDPNGTLVQAPNVVLNGKVCRYPADMAGCSSLKCTHTVHRKFS
jgi:hypothetical protein